jgi:glycosyltransferase involved in cell wall biosynthesis
VSAERIVKHLRAEYDVTVIEDRSSIPLGEMRELHREEGFNHFAFNANGEDKQAHQFLSDTLIALSRVQTPAALCAFYGDALATTVAITSRWIDTPFAVFLRGNDLDLEVFDPKSKLMWTLSVADRVFCVSREIEDKVLLLCPTAKTVYVPNSVAHDVFAFGAERAVASEPCFGLVGDIKAKKGLSLVLDSLNFPQERLRIVGSLRPDQMKLLHGFTFVRPDAASSIEVVSFTRDAGELNRLYQGFDYVLIPSLHEGMPNVMLEAMSSGSVVIASNVAGMKDVIVHGVNGWLFDPWVHGDLARVIALARSMSASELLAVRMAARATIEERYSIRVERRLYWKEFAAFLRAPRKASRRSLRSANYSRPTSDAPSESVSLQREDA